jgi:hypothetical protein
MGFTVAPLTLIGAPNVPIAVHTMLLPVTAHCPEFFCGNVNSHPVLHSQQMVDCCMLPIVSYMSYGVLT